ncbi:hypothetical protein [Stenotrophomonas forensis]|uniref:hypothetical protein n=1 Tax=Stenotrophomonas forensis TaxID=2871169 RepID=UPI0039C640E1
MAVRTANDLARAAQRSHDGRAPAEPNDEAFQFACDHVAAELEREGDVAPLVEKLSQARHVITHLLSQEVPAYLLPYVRELADLVRDMSARVDASMRSFEAGSDEVAA